MQFCCCCFWSNPLQSPVRLGNPCIWGSEKFCDKPKVTSGRDCKHPLAHHPGPGKPPLSAHKLAISALRCPQADPTPCIHEEKPEAQVEFCVWENNLTLKPCPIWVCNHRALGSRASFWWLLNSWNYVYSYIYTYLERESMCFNILLEKLFVKNK